MHKLTGLKGQYLCSLAATPTITEANSATSYEIEGTSITLTCSSTSGPGTYAWKHCGNPMYVILITFCITETNGTK